MPFGQKDRAMQLTVQNCSSDIITCSREQMRYRKFIEPHDTKHSLVSSSESRLWQSACFSKTFPLHAGCSGHLSLGYKKFCSSLKSVLSSQWLPKQSNLWVLSFQPLLTAWDPDILVWIKHPAVIRFNSSKEIFSYIWVLLCGSVNTKLLTNSKVFCVPILPLFLKTRFWNKTLGSPLTANRCYGGVSSFHLQCRVLSYFFLLSSTLDSCFPYSPALLMRWILYFHRKVARFTKDCLALYPTKQNSSYPFLWEPQSYISL
jgi:hypothetical protein